jgi:hypothetical protein
VPGTFTEGNIYTLSYTIDTTTGAISEVALTGSTSTYNFSSAAFTNSATAYAVIGNEQGGNACSFFDNFQVSGVVAPVPTVTAVSPTSGPIAGGTSVTISGTNFTGATAVSFGSVAASSFTVNSATSITAVDPAEAAGTVHVTVTTANGTSVTNAADQFTFVAPGAPTVTGLSPTSGLTTGGTSVTITGTNFTGATAVDFGSVAASSFTVNSATSITAVDPAEAAGTVTVTVTTPAGTAATDAQDQFTFVTPAPAVTSLSPTSGPTTGGTSVTITGNNFGWATAVDFGSVAATSFTVNSATSITAVDPAEAAGTVHVTVTTPSGSSATSSADDFTYETAPTLTAITVTPVNPSVARGLTEQFTATGTFSDGSTEDLTSQVRWASANTSVARISSAGLATAVAGGRVVIVASDDSIRGTTILTVTAAVLESIAVTPADPSVAKGLTEQFTAIGTYSDGVKVNLTREVSWASSSSSVATISKTGLAATVGTGSSTITATDGSISGSTTLTVTPAVLKSIALTPIRPTVAKGLTLQFTATGTFTDGSTQDLTTEVTWTSSNTKVATVDSAGLASGVGIGSTFVTASDAGIRQAITLTVTAPILESLSVTPADPSIAKGLTQQFTATGTFSDGSTRNLTTQVSWTSSSTSIVRIGSTGRAVGVAVGSATITAKEKGISGSTTLTVT